MTAQAANRIQKVLEDANVKLASVASDVLGKSGRAMLKALIEGQTDPTVLAAEARGRLRSKTEPLREAMEGRVTEHHRFMLQLLMDQLEQLETMVKRVEERIVRRDEQRREQAPDHYPARPGWPAANWPAGRTGPC